MEKTAGSPRLYSRAAMIWVKCVLLKKGLRESWYLQGIHHYGLAGVRGLIRLYRDFIDAVQAINMDIMVTRP